MDMRQLIEIVSQNFAILEGKTSLDAWFQGSKVLDDNGSPLIVWHGSDASFTSFEAGHRNGMTNPRLGFYFTDNKKAAMEFGNVKPFVLAIKNPADFRNGKGSDIALRVMQNDADLDRRYTSLMQEIYGDPYPAMWSGRLGSRGLLQTDEFIRGLQAIGHDGIFMDDNFAGYDFDSFITFRPDQCRPVDKQN